jgi:hypothetical protein
MRPTGFTDSGTTTQPPTSNSGSSSSSPACAAIYREHAVKMGLCRLGGELPAVCPPYGAQTRVVQCRSLVPARGPCCIAELLESGLMAVKFMAVCSAGSGSASEGSGLCAMAWSVVAGNRGLPWRPSTNSVFRDERNGYSYRESY